MSTVYFLIGKKFYEGQDILGAYTSRELAETAQKVYEQQVSKCTDYSLTEYDVYSIDEYTLNSPVATLS